MKTLRTIIITVVLTAIVSQNYFISHSQITGSTGNYTLTVLGNEYNYR